MIDPLGVVRRGGDSRVAQLVLNRPAVRNALDDTLVAALTGAARLLSRDPDVRVVVLSGEGKAFCAGADLNWMERTASYGAGENGRDAAALAAMFRAFHDGGWPVVARVQGAALGGGTGLVAVADVAVAADNAIFGTTEVRLGLVPAVIGPYVVRKIGESRARDWFLTGRKVGAEEALASGLVHRVVPANGLDAAVDAVVADLLRGGPEALAVAKVMASSFGRRDLDTESAWAGETIAARRVSAEGQEGMRAFLERRRPRWE